MPLYEDSKYHPLFIGDMHPVKLMDGNKVVFEPNVSELSGEGLSVNKTYNDSAFVRINGNTQEIGEGEKSPDNPYELKSVGDDGGFDLVSSGKNLFDPTKFPVTQTKNGVTVSRENDIITIDGTNNIGNATLYSAYFYLPSGNIRLSFRVIGGTFNNSVRVYLYQSGYIDGVVLLTGSGTTGSKTINISQSGDYRLAVYSQNGHSYIDCKIQIQLELGSTATPYTPFRGMQTVHIPYTLRSLPDGTADYILIDNVQKRAWWQSLTEKNILNSSSGFIYRADIGNTDGYSRFQKTIQQPVSGVGRCSHFNMLNSITSSNEGYIFSATYSYVGLVLSNSRLEVPVGVSSGDALSSLNDWLSVNPVTAVCKLANPPEPIELDYNAVKTFYPFTQIYTTATVQPTLDGKFRVWGS